MNLFSFKAFTVVLFATIKFLFSPAYAMGMGFSYWETVVLVWIGGYFSATVFFWAAKEISSYFQKRRKKKKKVFTKINRTVIRIKWRFGMVGLSFVVPIFLSIPIGCAIMAKFYRHQPKSTFLMILFSITCWTMFLSLISLVIPEIKSLVNG